jgi:hypothetical protein
LQNLAFAFKCESMKSSPPSVTIFAWLKANLGPKCLGGLTSTDTKALQAAVQIIELYAYDGNDQIMPAFNAVVRRMQPSSQYLAYHAIAHVMDWPHRREIWLKSNLPPLVVNWPSRCKFEPLLLGTM